MTSIGKDLPACLMTTGLSASPSADHRDVCSLPGIVADIVQRMVRVAKKEIVASDSR